ncbi:MAG: hypothetical protein ABSF28_17755 [Terracidiphilus sp.]|jgi:hypothetical protein
MDPRDEMEPGHLEALSQVFRDQLLACLEECAQGRAGLFASREYLGDAEPHRWPEAAQLRELALALQTLLAQQDEPSPLCDEFLDLCSIHGESNPGERKLARAFLARIEKGHVGTPTQEERKPW